MLPRDQHASITIFGLLHQSVLQVKFVVVVLDILGGGIELLEPVDDVLDACFGLCFLFWAIFKEVVSLLWHDSGRVLLELALGPDGECLTTLGSC